MGGKNSLPVEELNELLNLTNFKKQELKRWYRKFIKDFPHGQMSREQFMDIYTNIYKSANAQRLAGHIFRTFDTDNDNQICFKELMICFSVTSRGTVRSKLEWAFQVYDVDGSGRVTREEMRDIVKSMQQNANTVEEIRINDDDIAEMFTTMDTNADGSLSLDEFIDGVQKHPCFVNMLNGIMV